MWLCYGGDSGDNGDGRCGHHTRSPVKKNSRVKKQKQKRLTNIFTRGSRHVISSLIHGAMVLLMAVVVVLVVAECVKTVLPCFL